jgi:hypothetical protein
MSYTQTNIFFSSTALGCGGKSCCGLGRAFVVCRRWVGEVAGEVGDKKRSGGGEKRGDGGDNNTLTARIPVPRNPSIAGQQLVLPLLELKQTVII